MFLAAEPLASYRPVVLMHGLGDAGSNPGMQSLAQSVMTRYPGIYAVRLCFPLLPSPRLHLTHNCFCPQLPQRRTHL